MKDIDFDELDRAVSSVLGQKTPTAQDAPSGENAIVPKTESQSTVTSTPPRDDTSARVEPVASLPTASSPTSTSNPVPSVPLAVKRRGRFMDMVHPSASMSSVKPSLVKPLPSHRIPDLKPSAPVEEKAPEPVAVEPPVVSTVEHKAEPIAAVDESQALIGAEPMPLDDGSHTLPATTEEPNLDPLASFTVPDEADKPKSTSSDIEEPVDSHDEKPANESSEQSEGDPQVNSSLASSVPQMTPFLADTKVEKRPLGGFVDGDAIAAPPIVSDAQNPPAVPLPRELQSDVMKVEADQSMASVETPSAAPFATSVEAAPEPDDDRVEGHPLFDTSTYHEPIAAVPRKSMPAWLKWMLGLLVCLAIGAGVGYFLFTTGL